MDWLWAVWAVLTLGGFAALETWALTGGPLHELTYWLVYGWERWGEFIALAFFGFVGWISVHVTRRARRNRR